MAVRGKSINLFLMDGTAVGRIKCTLANWTGVAYKIPRTELDKCKERDDLKQSGVYFLFGTSDQTGENVVYIGQAGTRKNGEGILYRLIEHKRNPDKDYWTEAIVFTTSNNSFGPTEISYLENRFVGMATEAGRYLVKNSNDPTMGNITEEKESELEEFIDYAKIVMGTLGHKLFEALAEKSSTPKVKEIIDDDELTLFMKRNSRKSGKLIEASCKQTREGFVILKGSLIETIDSESIPPGIKERRLKAKIDEHGILQENVLVNSPSYAAAFVIGGHANGLVEWKTEDGTTLKEIENKEPS
ncbi:methionine sulfoxide reductase [Vagococcus acidifermentans]|uniref:Methionine sulfoxide reductase n=2 Tax=Vagococcus acidifermentans TaxID=564710 RepID=A0A430AZ19_9ENTE|nr:GIY-YIG nuclease family protein [Vagococcus acidifermentans]RSU13317.1 methionine sulfoxide reductase [Vagococcus acidifermentans]